MSFFQRFTKKKSTDLAETPAQLTKKTSFQLFPELKTQGDYQALLSASLGNARANQLRFGQQAVGNLDWSIDLQAGLIKFGDTEYPIQFIGSESESSNTWLWGWVNVNQLPEKNWSELVALRDEAQAYSALTQESLPLTETVNGHHLASIIASLYPDNACYYRCPYNGGAAYVLVKDLPETIFVSMSLLQIQQTITELISEEDLQHRLLAKGLLLQNQAIIEEEDSQGLVATLPTAKGRLTIRFDELGRIANMTSS